MSRTIRLSADVAISLCALPTEMLAIPATIGIDVVADGHPAFGLQVVLQLGEPGGEPGPELAGAVLAVEEGLQRREELEHPIEVVLTAPHPEPPGGARRSCLRRRRRPPLRHRRQRNGGGASASRS